MTFADTLSRITSLLALIGQILLILMIPLMILDLATPPIGALLVMIAAPSLSALAQLALSRNREYEADRTAAELTGDPIGLAAALERLELSQGRFWEQLMLPGRRLPDPSLLRTHPPTEQRIARLLELVPTPEARPAALAFPDGVDWAATLPFTPSRMGAPRWHITGLWH